MTPVDPQSALRQSGGAARRDALLAHGVTGAALSASYQRGEVLRPYRGTYCLPNTPNDLITAASLRGQLACVSACAWWGLNLIHSPDTVHVIVPKDRHPRDDRLRLLHLPGIHRADRLVDGRRIQPVAEAIDQAAWCTTPLEQLVIINSALHSKRIDPLEPPHLTIGTEYRRAWIHANARSSADSVPESVAGAVLNAAGLRPAAQVARDHVGTVDLMVGGRHIIEIDGYEPHSGRDQFAEDRRRDREISAQRGWSLRYTYWDVMNDLLAFALDVARIVGVRPDARLAARIRWMTTAPAGHLNRHVRRPGTVL